MKIYYLPFSVQFRVMLRIKFVPLFHGKNSTIKTENAWFFEMFIFFFPQFISICFCPQFQQLSFVQLIRLLHSGNGVGPSFKITLFLQPRF